jgi:predicted transcriptional regulator
MNAFIFGGIVGAAAVMYMMRSNKQQPTLYTAMSQAGQSVSKMFDTAKDKMVDMQLKKTARDLANQHNTNQSNMDTVKEIVKEDPTLKEQVEEILAANNKENSLYQ